MNTNKFTPGPWRVGDAGNTVFGPKMNDGSAPVIIASCDYQQTRLGGSKQANSRLIAAAPELIEASQRALMAITGYIHQNEITKQAINALQDAIAKATNNPQ